ncbi:MAG: hypothetical protein M3S32_00785 [Acidobacteriota bacterium]|nr:hypothetical protein [Acidobacteriota bacterium]
MKMRAEKHNLSEITIAGRSYTLLAADDRPSTLPKGSDCAKQKLALPKGSDCAKGASSAPRPSPR